VKEKVGTIRTRRRFRFPWLSEWQIAAEVEDELEFHLEEVAADLQAAGWTETAAREEARRRFGDVEFTRAYCRAQDRRREQEKRRMTLLEEVGQDLRYAARSLRGSPGYAVTAVLTLALGIGANTAIFSAVRGVLLDPLPFRDPDRIVRVYHANPSNGIARGAVSEPDFLDWRAASTTTESMAGYFFADGLSGLDLTGAGNPERLSAALVTDSLFETLGVAPLLGRTLRTDDQIEGRNRVVVLSHGLWTRASGRIHRSSGGR
jgi:hypothetical protein